MFATLLTLALLAQTQPGAILDNAVPQKGDLVALMGEPHESQALGWSSLTHIHASPELAIAKGTLGVIADKFASANGMYYDTLAVAGYDHPFITYESHLWRLRDIKRA